MAYLNQCNFIGNCADAPEIRTFTDGGKIATVRIAVTERFVDRSGQQKENTEWISCVFNGKLAETAEKYILKGSSIFVTGKYHTRNWQDQQGNKHYATEISVLGFQLLDKRQQQQPQQAPAPGYAPAPQSQAQPQYAPAPAPTQPQYSPAPQYQRGPQYPPQYDDLP